MPETPVMMDVNIRGTIIILSNRTKIVPSEVIIAYVLLCDRSVLENWNRPPIIIPMVIAISICQCSLSEVISCIYLKKCRVKLNVKVGADQ